MSVGNVYVGEGTVPPRRDLMQLIALGGGQVYIDDCEGFFSVRYAAQTGYVS